MFFDNSQKSIFRIFEYFKEKSNYKCVATNILTIRGEQMWFLLQILSYSGVVELCERLLLRYLRSPTKIYYRNLV